MDLERTLTLYDESLSSMKPSTVDQSQIMELEQTSNFESWLTRMTESEEALRPPTGLACLPTTSATAAASSQRPTVAEFNSVVPSVVEDKEAEDNDIRDIKLPTLQPGDRIPVTSLSSASRQPIHRQPYAFNGAAFAAQVDSLPMNGGIGQPAFIPLSVCAPKDEPQTVPCDAYIIRADRCKLSRKRERNRLAAQKCRARKLEQVTMLQERLQKLSRTKVELDRTVDELRRHINMLHRHLRQHINAGCQLNSAANFHL